MFEVLSEFQNEMMASEDHNGVRMTLVHDVDFSNPEPYSFIIYFDDSLDYISFDDYDEAINSFLALTEEKAYTPVNLAAEV